MYVPNYIPEPLEVPGNVTVRPYIERVSFIRRVTWIYSASILIATFLAFVPHPEFKLTYLSVSLAALLLVLDLFRIFLRGQAIEAKLSSAFLPLVLVLVGWLAGGLTSAGLPCWSILFSAASMFLYTFVCGRDYSFVGCYFLSMFVSSLAIIGTAQYLHLPIDTVIKASTLNIAYLSYAVYDLASLLARRKMHEVLASVTDLYRDVFNIFGYFYRCIQHWKKHQIW